MFFEFNDDEDKYTTDLAFYGELISDIDTLTHNYNRTVISTKDCIADLPLRAAGLNLIEQMVLRYIYLYGPFSMTTLSSLTNLKRAYVSRVTGGLEKNGYCVKKQSTTDQRVYFVELTEMGREKTKRHVENLRTEFLKSFLSLDKTQMNIFKENLHLVIHCLLRVMRNLDIHKEESDKEIDSFDLFELMDKRSKLTNKLILHFGTQKNLPFFAQNLNYYQNNIIFHLHSLGTMSVSALSRLTNFKLKHLCGTLDGLVDRGFLTKTPDPNDGRVRYVALSERGKKMADEQAYLEKICYKEALNATLSKKEQLSLQNAHKTLNKIFETLNQA